MLNGGLGDSVSQLLSRNYPLPLEMVLELMTTFGKGTPNS